MLVARQRQACPDRPSRNPMCQIACEGWRGFSQGAWFRSMAAAARTRVRISQERSNPARSRSWQHAAVDRRPMEHGSALAALIVETIKLQPQLHASAGILGRFGAVE